ncbi:MAG: hypothetical protein ACXVPU_12915, partial [Bacteroidia bacterium]
ANARTRENAIIRPVANLYSIEIFIYILFFRFKISILFSLKFYIFQQNLTSAVSCQTKNRKIVTIQLTLPYKDTVKNLAHFYDRHIVWYFIT